MHAVIEFDSCDDYRFLFSINDPPMKIAGEKGPKKIAKMHSLHIKNIENSIACKKIFVISPAIFLV